MLGGWLGHVKANDHIGETHQSTDGYVTAT
jgi:hypothetical protein